MKLQTMSAQMAFLLIAITFISTIKLSQAASSNGYMADLAANNEDTDKQEQRRSYNYDQLRRFLLTANADQRAARREQQDFYKRELIREFLDSAADSDPNRFEEVRKRFCASFDEFYATQAACLG